jgi:hypothetical protein
VFGTDHSISPRVRLATYRAALEAYGELRRSRRTSRSACRGT